MGKWSGLRGVYPKVPVDSDYLTKINGVLDSPAPAAVLGMGEADKEFRIRDLSDSQIVRLYDMADRKKDELADQIKILSLELAAFTSLLVERFDDEGEQTKIFDSGIRVTITPQPEPFVTDSAKLRAWVHENGLESLLTLAAGNMKKLAKDAIEGGKKLPDGTDVYLRDQLTFTRQK